MVDQKIEPIVGGDYKIYPDPRFVAAVAAMHGLLSDVETQRWLQTDPRFTGTNFNDVVAINAVEFADALLEQFGIDKQ